jgi:hypothetical protein
MKPKATPQESDPKQRPAFAEWIWTIVAFAYVAVVLGADWFVRGPIVYGADVFKFVAWFAIPFVACIPWMDWGYFGIKRLRRIDYALLGGVFVAELLAVLAVRLFPALRAALPHIDRHSVWPFVVWNVSWLLGWEFMHRYVLLRRVRAVCPKWGWLLIPVYEGAYHLNWPSLWMPAGMVVFSVIATWWSLKRQNGLLPFVAHLTIELQLAVFLLLS